MSDAQNFRVHFIWAWIVLAFYILCRTIIYESFPVDDYKSWALRDFIMDLPRGISFFGIVLVYYKFSSKTTFEGLFAKKGLFWSFMMLLILFTYDILLSFKFGWRDSSMGILVLLGIGSFFVGFFEEFLFRGLFFDSIKDRLGSNLSIFLTSLFFTFYHFQSHDLKYFPYLFCFGIALGYLRAWGCSLLALALLHSLHNVYIEFTNPLSIEFIHIKALLLIVTTFLLFFLERKNQENQLFTHNG